MCQIWSEDTGKLVLQNVPSVIPVNLLVGIKMP